MDRFDTFLFDLDGTLIDHFIAIHACYAHTLPRLGLPAPTPAQVRSAIGGGLEDAMRRFVPAARVPEAVALYRAYWDRHLLDGVSEMPGATDLLRMLRGRGARLGVLTNKLGVSSRLICDHLGFTGLIEAVVGAGDTPWLKPEAALTAHALALLGAPAAGAVLVGDSPFDIQAAHNGGIPAWVVTTGTHDGAALGAARADRIFPGLRELGEALSP